MGGELNFAIDLARQTGQILLNFFRRENLKTSFKPDHSIVTEADTSADEFISRALKAQYPDDLLLSEELQPSYPGGQAHSDIHSRAIWVIDPIDGTTNFTMGMHVWGVLLARLVQGAPELGVMFFPLIDEMYTAQAGSGAFLNGHPIHTREPNPGRPAAFFTCCSRTYRKYEVHIPYKTRILGSTAYSLCSVARGSAAVAFEATPKLWDIAPGWLLVQEAGGAIETLEGPSPFPIQSGVDYSRAAFPTLAAASPELANQARRQIRPRSNQR
jgi:myo-inositol-1(or 4)-monophosphatase